MTLDVQAHVRRLYPDHRIIAIEPFGSDGASASNPTAKIAGYGEPVHISLVSAEGEPVELVWRVASANELGHDRRADRAAEVLLAFDDFANVPDHVAPLDIGVVHRGGALTSLRDWDELYLITRFGQRTPYASDLRAVAARGHATERDLGRVTKLARYLGALHVPLDGPARYRRAIRDLIGSGEGIFGVVDSYPLGVPGAGTERLAAIEQRCLRWRLRLREHEGRLCRTHGDFHPFNILFDGDDLILLDASCGTCGDPADDVAALAVNYLLFALDSPIGWRGLGPLWHRLWKDYGELRPDASMRYVIPPFFAWRALVVCNPIFYPNLSEPARSSLLDLVECSLDSHHFDPTWAEELFR